MSKYKVVLILGSNQGDRQCYLDRAIIEISSQVGHISSLSGVYESDAAGYESENRYLNQALLVETILTPEELLEVTQGIERDLGRVRSLTERYSDRTIDIDILFFDDLIVSNEHLKIPHPEIAEREFVLTPLMDIIPELKHPVTGETIEQMWVKVRKMTPKK